jgi:uncharacterized protein
MKVFARCVVASLVLVSAVAMAAHDDLAKKVEAARKKGGMPAAVKTLEASAKSKKDKEGLLYNMELGQLQRLNNDIPASMAALTIADNQVKEWEESARTNPDKVIGMIGASLISERASAYEGTNYEKVWLTTMLALNRLATGDVDNARVDIKRTHEREAVIAQLKEKATAAAEKEAKEKGAEQQTKEIDGYPIDTLNSPEVLELKNGYQNALSHYLAGFVYELTNEPSLAAPGYRKAIELKPGSKQLEAGLGGLDARTSPARMRAQKMTDVLFIVEAGLAPARESQAFTVPVVVPGAGNTLSMSYPVVKPSADPFLTSVSAGDQKLELSPVADINVMARRELKDEMPGIVTRNITRAVTKGVVQKELTKSAGLFGAALGAVGSIVTEKADDRIWRTLPGRVYLARGYLPAGEHKLTVDGRDAGTVKISGRYALVPLRVLDDAIIPTATSTFGELAPAP